MKHLNIIIGLIILVFNALFGLLISSYSNFNILLTSGIIIISFSMIEVLKYIKLKDAFRISLITIFASLFVVQFILGVVSPSRFQDNGCLIAILIIIVIELITLITNSFISQKIK